VSLSGRSLLLTRDPAGSSLFIREAEKLGARVHPFPTIAILPPASWSDCDSAIEHLRQYAAIAFTSANAVRGFRRRCESRGITGEHLAAVKVYAVGAQTGSEVEAWGLSVSELPEEFSAAGLGRMLGRAPVRGVRVLLPQGNLAREELAEALTGLGATVDRAEVYRTEPTVPPDAEQVWTELERNGFDVAVFASPSAVSAFAHLYPAARLGPLTDRTAIAVIGPTTGKAVEAIGWHPTIIAGQSTMLGLLHAITLHFG
jgi:uroporphyrinogen-III synthase